MITITRDDLNIAIDAIERTIETLERDVTQVHPVRKQNLRDKIEVFKATGETFKKKAI